MVVVAAFYRFFNVDSCAELKAALAEIVRDADIYGTILIAPEGINGTVAGSHHHIDRLRQFFLADKRFLGMEYKESVSTTNPFIRRHIKIKKEIVTMNVPGIEPMKVTGRHVSAREWNELIADSSVVVLDVRNSYETAIGKFDRAIDPQLDNFSEFPAFVEKNLNPQIHKRIAMSCTGGIRCEKASAYLAQQGFDEVYQLNGGILRYFEDTPRADSTFRGECFVFDHRVAVGHDLKPGSYEMCFNCRAPVSAEDKMSPLYQEAVSCSRCAKKLTARKIASKKTRHEQMLLAESRGTAHLGPHAMPKNTSRACR